jgi:RNA polymerase sigma-70 factor (ECF subfamily)
MVIERLAEGTSEERAAALTSADDERVLAGIYRGLLRVSSVVCPPTQEPADLLQEAIARALTRGPLSRLDNPGAYLARAIVNLASNERRRFARLQRARQRVGTPEPPGLESWRHDLEVLQSVRPDLRAAVFLVDVEGMSHRDAAEWLDVSPAAVRKRVSRGRRALRETLEDIRSDS